MNRYELTPQAKYDMYDIWSFIAEDSLAGADHFMETLRNEFQRIAQFPGMGRNRDELEPGLKSYVVGNYLIFYHTFTDRIVIDRVLHGARDIEGLY